MSKLKTSALSLLLGAVTFAGEVDAQRSEMDILSGDVLETTLTQITRTPEAFSEVKVAFTTQFGWIDRVQNPFFTRFVSSEYVNFTAWPHDAPIWQREAYEAVTATLFIHKNHAQVQEVLDTPMYEGVRIVGVVRSSFQSLPWVEVLGVSRTGTRHTTASLAHLYRGEQLMQRRKWRLAISELSLAPTAAAPKVVRAAVHRNLGTCYLRLGEAGTAIGHFESALAETETKDHELNRLYAIARNAPREGLDSRVDRKGLKESERPFWEAFDDVGAATNQQPIDLGAGPR